MDSHPSTTQSHQQQQQQQLQSYPHHQHAASSAPQIRSRITVVCAECKRLKLKCDRRIPCGSCTKRDTIARCIYSPAAAEKVDLHSLNNRLIQVETKLAQLTSTLPLNSPFSPNVPPGSGSGSGSFNLITASSSFITAAGDKVFFTGSALSILHDVVAAWLDHLDLDRSTCPSFHSPPSSPTTLNTDFPNPVKLEPTPVNLPHSSYGREDGPEGDPASTPILPNLSVYHLSHSARTLHTVPTSSYSFQSYPPPGSSITPTLLSLLPVSPYRTRFLDHLQQFLLLRPSFPWLHFRNRIDSLFNSFDNTAFDPLGTLNPGASLVKTKAQTARDIFFGSSSQSLSRSSQGSNSNSRSRSTSPPPSTTSFFAAAAAAFALGALLATRHEREHNSDGLPSSFATLRDEGQLRDMDHTMVVDESSSASVPVRAPTSHGKGTKRLSPEYLHALSAQALSVHEASAPFDVDYLIACILQVMFLLQGDVDGRISGKGKPKKSGKGGGDGVLFPLVAKMVNIAQQIGLAMDPDEAPGRYNATEGEIRRRVWWEIFYYDLFVSDCMGHPPLIADGSYTTRLCVEVGERAGGEGSAVGSKFFELKCQFAQLVRSVKRLAESGPGYGIDQAVALEFNVRTWLDGLPEEWKVGTNAEAVANWLSEVDGDREVERVHMAQRCELAIGAYRLVMKVYAPFLRVFVSSSASTVSPVTPASAQPPPMPVHQAVHGAVNAAHGIVQASRLLWIVWDRYEGSGEDMESRRGAAVAPSLFDFCSFERGLVDAAVVCALAAVKQPGTVWAGVASEDIGVALEVLGWDQASRFGVGGKWEAGLRANEAVGIVDALRKKAEVAMGSPVGGGTKRKHSRSRSSGEPSVLHRPPEVSSGTRDVGMSAEHARARLEVRPTAVVRDQEKEKEEREKEKERKEKEKKHGKRPYPSVGIRVRPGRVETPLVRQRAGSGSTSTSCSSDSKMQAPNSLPPPSSSISMQMTGVPNAPIMAKSPPPSSTELAYQQQQQQQQQQQPSARMSTHATSSGTTGSEYSSSFTGELSPAQKIEQRRRFSIHDNRLGAPTHHHQPQRQQQAQVYQGYGNDSPSSGLYGHHSFDQPRHAHPRVSSSFIPPLASPFDDVSSSGPSGSEATAGPSPLSLSPPSFGHNPQTHTHLPSPPQFASRAHGLHDGPPMFTSSLPSAGAGGPLPSTAAQGLYLQTGYDEQFGAIGTLASPVSSTPSYDKAPMSAYGLKPPDQLREESMHHPQHQHQHQQPQYQVDGGHNSASQNPGFSLAPPQSWSQTSGTEYWTESYFR